MTALKHSSELLGRNLGGLLHRPAPRQDTTLAENYLRFGTSFGTFDFDSFREEARRFYEDALHSSDPAFTVITMESGQISIDYRGEVRGLFSQDGTPISFFRPRGK